MLMIIRTDQRQRKTRASCVRCYVLWEIRTERRGPATKGFTKTHCIQGAVSVLCTLKRHRPPAMRLGFAVRKPSLPACLAALWLLENIEVLMKITNFVLFVQFAHSANEKSALSAS